MKKLLFSLSFLFAININVFAQINKDTSELPDGWVKVKKRSDTIPTTIELSGEQIATKISNSIVQVFSESIQSTSQGSGVVMPVKNYILTNSHVVAGFTKIYILNFHDFERFQAEVIFQDKDYDIAILKINVDNPFSPITLGTSVKQGATIYAMGSPLGLPNLITKGIVSALVKSDDDYHIIHDASIGSGNSGGALVNTQGNLVGINVMSTGNMNNKIIQNINYAIPLFIIKKVLKENNLEYILKQ